MTDAAAIATRDLMGRCMRASTVAGRGDVLHQDKTWGARRLSDKPPRGRRTAASRSEEEHRGKDRDRENDEDPLAIPAFQVTGVVEDDRGDCEHIKSGKQHSGALFFCGARIQESLFSA